MMRLSLRRSALLWTTVLLTAVGAVAFVIAYEAARQEAAEFLDGQLRQIALNAGDGIAATVAPPADQDEEDKFVIDVWDTKTGSVRKAVGGLLPQLSRPGFDTIDSHGESWRVYLARDAHTTAQVGQRMVVREEIAQTSAIEAGAPVLLTIPLAWIVIGLSLSRVLRPLAQLAETIAARGIESSEPIPTAGAPMEIAPLLEAMNGLAARLHDALERQRRFVSDAAHELRTPLAALTIQIDNLAAWSKDSNREAVEEMRSGISRASTLVRQLLRMARIDSQQISNDEVRVDPAELVTDCVANVVSLAEAKQISLGLRAEPVGLLKAAPDDLILLFGNLLDNAIRYTDSGGAVDISIKKNNGSVEVEITDSGCGISERDLPRVFDRFFRAAPPGVEGTGLGLAIAKAVADRYGLRIELANRKDRRGLRATVTIPASTERPHSLLRIRA